MRTQSIRKTLDRLAYASLVLDICIALITLLTIFDIQQSQRFLMPINYLLTVVVLLSIALFAVLLALKSKEKLSLKKWSSSSEEPDSQVVDLMRDSRKRANSPVQM